MDAIPLIAILAWLCPLVLASQCRNMYVEPAINVDHLCIENTKGSNVSSKPISIRREDITFKVHNSSAGDVEVRFILAPNSQYNYYTLKLYVTEMETSEEGCRNVKMPFSCFRLHSSQMFDVLNCSEIQEYGEEDCTPSCEKMAVVKFPYVFPGCYYIRLTPVKDGREGIYSYSWPTLIHTDFKKVLLWNVSKLVHHQCLPNKNRSWEVILTLHSHLITERIPLHVWLRKQYCAFSDFDEYLAGWVVDYTGNGHVQCSSKEGSSIHPNNCSLIDNGRLECIFSNVQPGNYCVSFIPWEPVRCNSSYTVWTRSVTGLLKSCLTIYEYLNCPEYVPETGSSTVVVENESQDEIYIAIAAVLSILVVVAIVLLVARRHIKTRPMVPRMDLVPSSEQTSQPKVLLLYAQDCKEFMQLMTTFRHLLAKLGHCEVVDCFDEDRAEEIAKSPVEWMCQWASAPDVKVVVVASECAVAHQKALSTGISLQYRNPTPNSHLFLYGLKEITYNHKKGEYTNTFVVRFDHNDLGYLTPYTRFVLPLHLQELLRSLNPNLDVSCVGERWEEQKLRDSHKEMMEFKRQNPQYFGQLMVKCVDVAYA